MDDGLLMYYLPVDAKSCFSFTATATILRLNPEIEQVAFGLMARDDLLIDTACQYPLGDYVATGYHSMHVSAFGRRNSQFITGAPAQHIYHSVGQQIQLSIQATSDGYSLQYGNNPVQSAGFDYALTRIDCDTVYVGMFVSRNATVAFSNIHFQRVS